MDSLVIRKAEAKDMQGLSDLFACYSVYGNTLQLPDGSLMGKMSCCNA